MAKHYPLRATDVEPDDEAIDRASEDSFPASDPPSYSPVTGLGAPAPEARTGFSRRWRSSLIAAMTVLTVAVGAMFIARGRRRQAREAATARVPRPERAPEAPAAA